MRFLAAPWLGLLNDDVWLQNARRANSAAKRLADRLRNEAKIDVVFPVEASAVFLQMKEEFVRDLRARGWQFYKFIEPDIYRVMCSWSVTNEEIADFVSDVKTLQSR
jgi:threonine aldolase